MEIKRGENCIIPILFARHLKNVNKIYDELLKPYGLSKFHGAYLICLFRNPNGLKLNDLNRIIGCDKANTSRAIMDLESKNLICKNIESDGEKKYSVRLTENGREIAEKFVLSMRNFGDKMFSRLDEVEQKQFFYLINKMYGGDKC